MSTAGTRHAIVNTPIGEITLVAAGPALTGVYFPGHWYLPRAQARGEQVAATRDAVLSVAARQLQEYLDGTRDTFDLPVETHGDVFQERVWSLLAGIPYGETTTYGDLTKRLGRSDLARDVGQAVGRNPLTIIVPCHRVIGKNGKLTGYAGGLRRKEQLLELEARRRRADLRQLDLLPAETLATSGR